MSRTLPKFPDNLVSNPLEFDRHDRRPSSAPSPFNGSPPKVSPLQKLLMVGAVVSAVGIVVTPALLSHRQPRVISIYANDLSKSALSDIHVAQQHCSAAARLLKKGDYAVSIGFADRAEVTEASVVNDEEIEARPNKCNEISRDRIPPTLGKQQGTNLVALLEEVETQLKSQRTRGNQNPGVITIWLQNAEPRHRGTVLDLKRVRSQLQQITDDHSTIAIFGPTGQLHSDLEKAIQDNPRVELCPIRNSETCIKQAFGRGRKLP